MGNKSAFYQMTEIGGGLDKVYRSSYFANPLKAPYPWLLLIIAMAPCVQRGFHCITAYFCMLISHRFLVASLPATQMAAEQSEACPSQASALSAQYSKLLLSPIYYVNGDYQGPLSHLNSKVRE